MASNLDSHHNLYVANGFLSPSSVSDRSQDLYTDSASSTNCKEPLTPPLAGGRNEAVYIHKRTNSTSAISSPLNSKLSLLTSFESPGFSPPAHLASPRSPGLGLQSLPQPRNASTMSVGMLPVTPSQLQSSNPGTQLGAAVSPYSPGLTPFGNLNSPQTNAIPNQQLSSSYTSPSFMHAAVHPARPPFGLGNCVGIPEQDAPMQPARHIRSYSHNLTEALASMRPVGPSAPNIRPRAFSSSTVRPSMSSVNPGGLGTSSSSLNGDPFESRAFPPPLSSPVSPIRVGQPPLVPQTSQPQFLHQPLAPDANQVYGYQYPSFSQFSSAPQYPSAFPAPSTPSSNATKPAHSPKPSINATPDHPVSTSAVQQPGHARKHSQSYLPPPKDQPLRRSLSGIIATDVKETKKHSRSHSSSQVLPGAGVDVLALTNDQILTLCQDQRGCRFLQRKLSCPDDDVVNKVFNATCEHVVQLMVDPFGNYFCQKLFERCSVGQVTSFLKICVPTISQIAVNQHGTRALQRLMERIETPEQVTLLVNALRRDVVSLIRDLNGNHVIQKLLLTLRSEDSMFIYDAACESIIDVGSHRHGCCVLQKCLAHASPKNQRKLVDRIIEEALSLVGDPFGNYVCQYVFDLENQEYTDRLVEQFSGRVLFLSMQKFSSNVVEKSLVSSSPKLAELLITEIIQPDVLHELLLDNYGNYVIQTAIDASGKLGTVKRQRVITAVQTALSTTRSPYGRRIMTKIRE